jgi:putative N6-adenine-specific DNA methylase
MEELLANELSQFGARDVKVGNRAVEFRGDKGTIYKANFRSRFALRILKPIKQFAATNEETYYGRLKGLAWENIIPLDKTFAVRVALGSEYFNHSQFMAQKAKDAIADRIRDKKGARPNVNLENPNIPIHIHIRGDQVTVSLDSSGESLHMRGYREHTGLAPINEVLAAAIVEFSGWEPHLPFYDAMCGSGTIAIEAAIKGLNIPPGLFRKLGYAFEHWPDFDKPLLDTIAESALDRISDQNLRIFATDSSANIISKAKKNIYNAELEDDIDCSVADFFDLKPISERGTVVLNPPYGERMDKDDVDDLYKRIGDAFKQNFAGHTCLMISSNFESLKKVGLKSTFKKPLYNGKLECRLVRFDMFEGSRKFKETTT